MPTQREPAVAGRFYPAERQACERMLDEMLGNDSAPPALAAIVPHAGWVYSGPTAALSLSGVKKAEPETIIVFGAMHTFAHNDASVYGSGGWVTPLGTIPVDDELGRTLTESELLVEDPTVHAHEHSIEVQLPLIRRLMKDARILPIMVRPGPAAPEVGRICARQAAELGRRVAFVGSTDLTHYGPAFSFEPHGRGEAGIRWAKEVNDRRFVELIAARDADAVVPEAARNRNACGAGAVAAAIGATLEAAGGEYVELCHTTSAEVEGTLAIAVNSVGYEAGVFQLPS
ncbi:MAG: AmmeMemoRadiSam system protein B [Planctomycetes bacterium]|nr:AmmeMemoRadiSam system protein B [Planctomycetota bacterium]